MSVTSMSIRVDDSVKKQAQELFTALGLDLSTAVNVFLRRAIAVNGLPFDVTLKKPNKETLEAMAEVEYMKKHQETCKGYTDAETMFKEILS